MVAVWPRFIVFLYFLMIGIATLCRCLFLTSWTLGIVTMCYLFSRFVFLLVCTTAKRGVLIERSAVVDSLGSGVVYLRNRSFEHGASLIERMSETMTCAQEYDDMQKMISKSYKFIKNKRQILSSTLQGFQCPLQLFMGSSLIPKIGECYLHKELRMLFAQRSAKATCMHLLRNQTNQNNLYIILQLTVFSPPTAPLSFFKVRTLQLPIGLSSPSAATRR